MIASEQTDAVLPREAAPFGRAEATLLFAIRRTAIAGLDDAHATNAFLGLFGMRYRRPLVLLRALMAELARASAQTIHVSPCCCMRMTSAEAAILRAVALAPSDLRPAHAQLVSVLGTFDCLGAVSSAQALGQAFADFGRPL
jgi:hypothetical protein